MPLKNLLNDSIRRAKIAPEVEATLAMEQFTRLADRIWGSAADGNMRAVYIKNQCMTVAVLSNIYAQEIKLRERDIVREINEKMGKTIVSRITCLV